MVDNEKIPFAQGSKAVLKGPVLKLPNENLIQYMNKRSTKISLDMPAIVHDGVSTLSYRQLDKYSTALASAISPLLGINGNMYNQYAIALSIGSAPSVEVITCILSIIKLGLSYLPLNTKVLPKAHITQVFSEVRPVLFILTGDNQPQDYDELKNKFSCNCVTLKSLWDKILLANEPSNTTTKLNQTSSEAFQLSHEDEPERSFFRKTVVLLKGPGANGNITYMPILHEEILNWVVKWQFKNFPMKSREYILSMSELDSAMSLIEILSAFLSGHILLLLNKTDTTEFSVTQVINKVEEFNIRRLFLYPDYMKSLLSVLNLKVEGSGNEYSLMRNVNYWFLSGNNLQSELAKEFFIEFGNSGKLLVTLTGIDNNFGPLAYQIYHSLDSVHKLEYFGTLPIGKPLPNIRIYITNEQRHLTYGDAIGIMCYSTFGLRLTNKFSIDTNVGVNPFTLNEDFWILVRTSDLARLIKYPDGQRRLVPHNGIYQLSRFSCSSKTIYIGEINSALRKLSGSLIKDFYVMPFTPSKDVTTVVAFYTLAEDVLPTEFAIKSANLNVENYLFEKLPLYSVPDIIYVSSIPRIPSENYQVNIPILLRYYQNIRLSRKELKDEEIVEMWNQSFDKDEIEDAKILFSILSNIFDMDSSSFIEILDKSLAVLQSGVFQNPATSDCYHYIKVLDELYKHHYSISLHEFISFTTKTESIRSLVKLLRARRPSRPFDLPTQQDVLGGGISNYTLKPLGNPTSEYYKQDIFDIFCQSATEFGTFENYLGVTQKEMSKYLDRLWPKLIQKQQSWIMQRLQDKKVVGLLLALDWDADIFSKRTRGMFGYKLDFVKTFQDNFINQLKKYQGKQKGVEINLEGIASATTQIMWTCILPQVLNFGNQEYFNLLRVVIQQCIKQAKQHFYTGILFTTMDPIAIYICTKECGFTVISEYVVGNYVCYDGQKRFKSLVPKTYKATLLYWKNDRRNSLTFY